MKMTISAHLDAFGHQGEDATQVAVFYVLDETGHRWQIRATDDGLEIRALGRRGDTDDSIRVRPVHANTIRVHSTHEEE